MWHKDITQRTPARKLTFFCTGTLCNAAGLIGGGLVLDVIFFGLLVKNFARINHPVFELGQLCNSPDVLFEGQVAFSHGKNTPATLGNLSRAVSNNGSLIKPIACDGSV